MTPCQKGVKIIRNWTLTSVQDYSAGSQPMIKMSQFAWWWLGSTVTRSPNSSPPSEDSYTHTIAAAHTLSCWVRSLQGIQPHTTVLLSSISRGKERLCWKMVFYDNHAASAKQINLFHAFYPHCRQLQERGTCCWKACFTDTVREQSDIT